jgi:hypothetical protein
MKKNLIAIGISLIILIFLAIVLPPSKLSLPSTATPDTLVTDPTAPTTSSAVPQALPTKYISSTNWPPQFSIVADPFTCKAGTTGGDVGLITVEKTINGHDYCITTQTEGAAGSSYTTYTYLTSVQGSSIKTTFTLQYPQCDNYSEPQKTECSTERSSFNIDSYIDTIITAATAA